MTKSTNTNTTKPTNTPTTDASSTLLAGIDVKGFQIAPPMLDVRGWTVVGPDGAKIGTIDRIMLDASEKKPRYLSVALPKVAEYLLLPIGVGSIDPTQKQVKLDSLKLESLNALPVLTNKIVTAEFEQRVYHAVTGKESRSLTATQRYADPVFDPMQLFASSRATLQS